MEPENDGFPKGTSFSRGAPHFRCQPLVFGGSIDAQRQHPFQIYLKVGLGGGADHMYPCSLLGCPAGSDRNDR